MTSRWHLKYVHGEELPHINAIWREEITPITHVTETTVYKNDRACSSKIVREDVREQVEPIIAHHLYRYQKAIKKILTEESDNRVIIREFNNDGETKTTTIDSELAC